MFSLWISVNVKIQQNLFQEIRSYLQNLLSRFLEICKSLPKVKLMPKTLVARKRFCVGGASKEFQKKWDCNLKEIEMKFLQLLLEEYGNKLFSLMDSFWVEISGKRVDNFWLVTVRCHLDEVEKEQKRLVFVFLFLLYIYRGIYLSTLSGNPSLKK